MDEPKRLAISETALTKLPDIQPSPFVRPPQKHLSERIAEVALGTEVPGKLPGWATAGGGLVVAGLGITAALAVTWIQTHALAIFLPISVVAIGSFCVLFRGLKHMHRRLLDEVDAHTKAEVDKAVRRVTGELEAFVQTKDAEIARVKTDEQTSWHQSVLDLEKERDDCKAKCVGLHEINEDFRRYISDRHFGAPKPPAIDQKWWTRDQLELWQLVTLALNYDPDKLPGAKEGTADLRRSGEDGTNFFQEYYNHAWSHLGGALPGNRETKTARLVDFAKWAEESSGWTWLPGQFQGLAKQ